MPVRRENAKHANPTAPKAVVGVGAGAGGLEALKQFLEALPNDAGAAFVVVQHIDTGDGEVLADAVAKLSPLSVRQLAASPTPLEANCVFVVPQRSVAQFQANGIVAVEAAETTDRAAAVDALFQSIASIDDATTIGIVLSGRGNDGTLGFKAIRDAGGMTIAQSAESASHDEMPRSAAFSGHADHVLDPQHMAEVVANYVRQDSARRRDGRAREQHDAIRSELPAICEALQKTTEHDFRHYKKNTLVRRIARRMQALCIESVDEYLNRLREDHDEARVLFRDLLISVTAFFRDPDVFAALENLVIPQLIENRQEGAPIRIWIAGCATGEEAYTLAMLMREALDSHRDGDARIFATDIDQRALQVARAGRYPKSIAEQLTEGRLARFFTKSGDAYVVSKELRDMCVFSAHNLISDPPFSQMDLISCRNLLIYLGEPLQLKLIPLFHFALRPGGFLMLGTSESLTAHTEIFRPIDERNRISQRRAGPAKPSELLSRGQSPRDVTAFTAPSSLNDVDIHKIAQRIVLDEFAPRWAVVTEDAHLVSSSTGLEEFFEFPDGPFRNNVVQMARPGIRGGLRTSLRKARESMRTVRRGALTLKKGDDVEHVELVVQPMPEIGEHRGLFMLVFRNLGASARASAADDYTDADQVIAELDRELAQTRIDLEETVQNLEASNEELKSSNEELLSMNEELQTANEELKTSKEEIEAGAEALAKARNDLKNFLEGTQVATIFLNANGRVNSFTQSITDIFNLQSGDEGRPLSDVTHNAVEMPPLPEPESVAAEAEPRSDELRLNDGRWFLRRALPYFEGERNTGVILTFTDISEQKRDAFRLATARDVTHLLATADAFEEVIPEILEAVRSNLGAEVCSLWLVDQASNTLYCEETVTSENAARFRSFVEKGRDLRLARGEGLAGHIWRTKQPHWILDVEHEANFKRRDDAMRCGLLGAAGMPIMAGKRFHGSIEFYADHVITPDESLLEMLGEVGREIGQFIRRRRLDERLRTEETRKLAILDAALDCIITMRIDGTIVDFNTAAEETFGIKSADAAGQSVAELIIPAKFRGPHRDGLKRFLKTGESKIIGERIEVTALRADGTEFPAELAIRVTHNRDGSPFFTAYLRDISERRAVEKKLVNALAAATATEAKLRVLFDQSLYFAGMVDLDGVLTDVNKTALVRSGFDRDAIVGRPLWDAPWWASAPSVQNTIRAAVKKAAGGETYRAELPYWIRDGSERRVDFALTPVVNDAGEILFIVPTGSDITQSFKLKQSLAETARRTNMALQAGGMVSWEWTPTKSVWDDGLFELLGAPVDPEPTPELFFQFVHKEDLEGMQRAWRRAIDGERPYDHEFRIVRPNGEIRWIKGVGESVRDETGEVVSIYGLNWDVTRQKRAEKRQQRSAELEHFLLEATTTLSATLDSDAVLAAVTHLCVPGLADWAFIDLMDGDEKTRRVAVAHANPADAELAAKVAQFPAKLEWPDHPPAHGLFLGEGLLIQEFTEEWLQKSAQNKEHARVIRTVRPKSLIVIPLLKRGKAYGALTLIVSDSGRRFGKQDLKTAEEFARRASFAIENARLFEAAELASRSKSEFVANMSHEIRTPMTAVLGYADLLAASETNPEKSEYIEIIKRNGEALLDLINDILDLSKIESGKLEVVKERFALQNLIADIRSTMDVRARAKNLEFQIDYEGDIPAVMDSDPKMIRQVLMNLVGNAIKFTESGEVRLRIQFLDGETEPRICFHVIDTGVGVPEAHREQLFEPFSQGDASVARKFGGTGLGLAISQRIARLLGGEITLRSTPGKGSVFSCAISAGEIGDVPLIDPTAGQAPPKLESLQSDVRLVCRVLVVDDRRDVRFLTRHILASAGAEVSVAEDGLAAIQQAGDAENGMDQWDLILLDMQMPRLDGYQTAKRLRSMGFSKPIIALTADAMHGDMDLCIESGCDAYLSKPIDAGLLVAMVAQFTNPDRADATQTTKQDISEQEQTRPTE